jgi:hypothetical protein
MKKSYKSSNLRFPRKERRESRINEICNEHYGYIRNEYDLREGEREREDQFSGMSNAWPLLEGERETDRQRERERERERKREREN